MKCRHCDSELKRTLVDLGSAPPSNAYLTNETLHQPEKWYPLRVLVCEQCWLTQTEDFAQAQELFAPEYAYYSSYSSSWLAHCEKYVSAVVARFGLASGSRVIEIGSNDGYLLQYVKARGIQCIGVDATSSTAAIARGRGIETIESFFDPYLAKTLVDQGKQADLIVANNVLAHVPDINAFVQGFAILLKPQGVATFEFPYLCKLLEETQFDTIYHEHFSYLVLEVVNRIFSTNGLRIFDVEEITTHGGSLRVFAQRSNNHVDCHKRSAGVYALLQQEHRIGVDTPAYYSGFQHRTDSVKDNFLAFLLATKRLGKTVAAYGAAAKGNTLLNYAGVRPDLIPFVVDRNPAKQGRYMPGSRIPIVAERELQEAKPDYVLLLPWNLKEELVQQLAYIREWGGKFVTAVPRLEVS